MLHKPNTAFILKCSIELKLFDEDIDKVITAYLHGKLNYSTITNS